jgi:hypothetical protein
MVLSSDGGKNEQDAWQKTCDIEEWVSFHTCPSDHVWNVNLALRVIFLEGQRITWEYETVTSEALEGTWSVWLLKAWGTNIIDIFKCWAAVTLKTFPLVCWRTHINDMSKMSFTIKMILKHPRMITQRKKKMI